MKSKDIFTCPSDSVGKRTGNSYAANSCLFTSQAAGLVNGKSMTSFEDSTKWMLFGEEASDSSGSSSDASFLRTNSTDDAYILFGINFLSTRHTSGSTTSFIDGHAKWLRSDRIVADHLLIPAGVAPDLYGPSQKASARSATADAAVNQRKGAEW